jgi:carbamoyl-phosphate synthase large subunit
MKSTGEVMGIDMDFGKAFYKSQDAAMSCIPRKGTVFISVKDTDKPKIAEIARQFHRLGFKVVSTKGTAQVLRDYRVPVQEILKIVEGSPNIADWVKNKKMDLIINTPSGKGPMLDEGKIRSLAVAFSIPCITTLSAAKAALRGLQAVKDDELDVKSIHDYHGLKGKG